VFFVCERAWILESAAAALRAPLHLLCPAAPCVRMCVYVSVDVDLCVVRLCVCMFVFSRTPSTTLPCCPPYPCVLAERERRRVCVHPSLSISLSLSRWYVYIDIYRANEGASERKRESERERKTERE